MAFIVRIDDPLLWLKLSKLIAPSPVRTGEGAGGEGLSRSRPMTESELLRRLRPMPEEDDISEWIDASIELMRPGVTTDQVARVWPKAEEFGFDNEMECFGLQFGHSVGLFLHERPIISRLNSLDHPVELKEGMVIALETYCPASDGVSAARIEEEVVVTADGPVVITRFPSQELFVANRY